MSFLEPKASKSTSSSQNVNNALITGDYSGQIGTGTTANANEASLLSGTPTAAATAGYQNYLQEAGYQPAMTALSKNITGQGAASGLLDSGSTTKALQSSGAALNNTYFNNYLQNLSGLSSQGTTAGGLVAGTGSTSSGTSTGQSPSTLSGIASTVGGIASIFSDRRLKTDIRKLGEFKDGLGKYSFRYKFGTQRFVGVMADEVRTLRPWAIGPSVAGFDTVNYGAL